MEEEEGRIEDVEGEGVDAAPKALSLSMIMTNALERQVKNSKEKEKQKKQEKK